MFFGLLLPIIGAAEKSDQADGQRKTMLNEKCMEPEADKILQEMGNSLKNQKEFSVKADVNFELVEPTGEMIQYSATNSFVIHFPF